MTQPRYISKKAMLPSPVSNLSFLVSTSNLIHTSLIPVLDLNPLVRNSGRSISAIVRLIWRLVGVLASTMAGEGVFDYAAIRQSCWQTCDRDPAEFPMDLNSVPLYRDDDTRGSFYNVTTFFGCVERCEDSYTMKRVAIITPAVSIAALSLLVLILCWFWRGCPIYKWRQGREKTRKLSSSSSSLSLPVHYASSKTVRGDGEESGATFKTRPRTNPGQSRKYSKSQGSSSAQWSSGEGSLFGSGGAQRFRQNQSTGTLEQPPHDMDASWKSNVSVNSWVKDSRKSVFLATATKLGRKLAHLDQKSEEMSEKQADRRGQRTRRKSDGHEERAKRGGKYSEGNKRSRSVHKDRNGGSGSSKKMPNPTSKPNSGSGKGEMNQPPMRF